MAAMTADEVWAVVKAEVEAMYAALGAPPLSSLTRREQQLMRIGSVTAWRLATERCADSVEKVVAGG